MNKKILKILLNMVPVILMISLIPFVKNDYILFSIYLLIILGAFVIKYEKKEWIVFMFGFFAMIFFEYIFVSTGVEIFLRNSLLNKMPLWLPLIWGYGFVAIKRSVLLLNF